MPLARCGAERAPTLNLEVPDPGPLSDGPKYCPLAGRSVFALFSLPTRAWAFKTPLRFSHHQYLNGSGQGCSTGFTTELVAQSTRRMLA